MGMFNRHLQLIQFDCHIGFEGRDALIGPVVHRPAGILGAAQSVQLRRQSQIVADVGAGDMQLRSGHLSRINHLLQGQIRVRLHAAGGTRGGNAARQVQPRRTVGHLAI